MNMNSSRSSVSRSREINLKDNSTEKSSITQYIFEYTKLCIPLFLGKWFNMSSFPVDNCIKSENALTSNRVLVMYVYA